MSIEFWDEKREVFRTKKGGWNIPEGVNTHGYSLYDDLVGKKSFFELLLLHVTGVMPDEKLAYWLECSFMCLSWPDPRIWCNQIGSLGGSSRTSPVSAICAALMAADSKIYGVGTLGAVFDFMSGAKKSLDSGGDIASFIEDECQREGKLVVPGFARPIAKGDERVEVMIPLAKSLGFGTGEFLSLALKISDYLISTRDESINFAAYIVSFLMDQKFQKSSILTLFSLLINGGVHACFVESNEDLHSNSFLPQKCQDIIYNGPCIRSVKV